MSDWAHFGNPGPKISLFVSVLVLLRILAPGGKITKLFSPF
jgi:hypothetical protein